MSFNKLRLLRLRPRRVSRLNEDLECRRYALLHYPKAKERRKRNKQGIYWVDLLKVSASHDLSYVMLTDIAAAVAQDDFLNSIRSGEIVSKA